MLHAKITYGFANVWCFAADVNLAFNKTVSRSSVWGSLPASNVVDDVVETEACTSGDIHPWFSVDLGAEYDVGRVTVTNDANPSHGVYRLTYSSGVDLS